MNSRYAFPLACLSCLVVWSCLAADERPLFEDAATAPPPAQTPPKNDAATPSPPAPQKQTIEKPAKVDKVTAQWDELSQQIITGICRSNIDFGAMVGYARSFRCDLDIRITSALFAPATGTLSYWWEDADDNGLLVGDEIQIEIVNASSPAMRQMMSSIKNALVLQTATAGANVFRDHLVQSVRTADGYKMKLVPSQKDKPVKSDAKADKDNLIATRGYDALYLTVTSDFRVTRMRAVNEATETELVINLEHEKLADLWAGSGYYKEVLHSGRSISVESGRCEYVAVDRFPMLRSLTISSGITTPQGTVGMKQEYTVRDPKVLWRDQPLDMRRFAGGEDDEKLFKEKKPGPKPAEDDDARLFDDKKKP